MDTKKIFFLLLIGMFMISMVSAFEFDNVKSYDPVTREVTITNLYGFGDTIGKARLNTPLNVIVHVGYQKVAEFEITSYRDYDNALKQFTFKDMNNGKVKINREYDLKYLDYEDVEVDDYKTECNKILNINKSYTDVCEKIKISSHTERKAVWNKINPADLKKNEKITVGVFTEVEKGDYVDWVPTIYGREVKEWATWTASLNVDLEVYYTLDEASGTVAEDSILNYNLTNVGATVNQDGILGKSYLFEASGYGTGDTAYTTTSSIGLTDYPFTYNAWFKGSGTALTWGGIVGINHGIGEWSGLQMGTKAENLAFLNRDDTGGDILEELDSGVDIYTGSWVMVSAVFTSATDRSLWVNGNNVLNTTTNLGFDTDINAFQVGNAGNGKQAPSIEWGGNGYIDEIGVWSRALSKSELEDLYNGGTGITYTNVFTTPPNITLNSPTVDANYTTVQNLIINFTVYDDINLSDVKLYINGALNQTNASGINDSNYLFNVGLYDGDYTINGVATNNQSETANSSSVRFVIDTTSPVISLGNVTNLSTISNSTLQLNGTDTNIDNCYYNNTQNSTYIIVTCGSWFNITWTTAGSKDVQYCANDTFGQETCATSSLTVYNLSTSTTDSPDPVGELRPVQYDLIVREVVTTLPTTTANLVHNGTTYQLTAILTNSTEYHFQKNITMQDGWGSSTGNNISFNWAYNVSGLGEYTTSTENTTVLAVSFDDCTALGDVILNWSLHDEGNNSLVNATAGADVEIDLQVYYGTATTTWTHNETWTSKSAGAICVPTGLLTSSSDYVIDFTMGFQATDHVWEFFYLDNGNLNSTKIFDGQTNGNITLMDLLTADSTSFLFNYFDVDGLAVEDSIVHVFRKYIGEGTFREVERAKADDNGDATIHLVEEDVIYYFQITQYGVVLYTSNEYTALCQDTPCTIQLEASSGGSTFGTDWDLVDNGGYEIYTSSTTREVNLTYILTSPSTMNLTVFNYNSDGSYSVVNSSTDTGTTGSFIVTVPQSAGNVSFFATVYQDGEFINSEWVDFSGQASDYFGSTLALFLGALIILSLGLMSISEGAGTIIWIILGVFIAGGMGLIATGLNTGISITIYLICAGGILLWKLTRGRK